MALAHVVVLTVALVLPLTVPYAVAVALRRDEFRRRRAWADCPAQARTLTCLDRDIRDIEPDAVLARLAPPPIEWLARDLRRLDRQRRGGITLESELLLEAVMRAYDERLCLACECLGVQENLRPLDGMDREIERVRVEGALEAAGLALR
ncbi:hypothetical protein [Paractinoplanes brasiliensis]|uniref:hypothetical protein n=1 Tax=Paractinoplanes brasiliensis TaxID=52695 RepID=UPI001060FC47|nr:hypothetical protein [Actinoplanes brasiliensis]GID30173.1 hypothetical protein Abr02nite_51560 [Actinoplanes brasiliensis]